MAEIDDFAFITLSDRLENLKESLLCDQEEEERQRSRMATLITRNARKVRQVQELEEYISKNFPGKIRPPPGAFLHGPEPDIDDLLPSRAEVMDMNEQEGDDEDEPVMKAELPKRNLNLEE